MMDALERVKHIRRPAPEPWPPERLLQAAEEGVRRWRGTEGHFCVVYSPFQDAVRGIDPPFELPPGELDEARAAGGDVAARYVKWERCPQTAGRPNPYEPWVEI